MANEDNPTAAVTAAPTEAPTQAPTAIPTAAAAEVLEEGTTVYQDGVYEVQTEPDYEKYYTKATVTIEGGKITSVDWTIYDEGNDNVPFDSEYYKILAPYGAVYEQQGKDDWAGSRGYTDALIESQDVDKVDAVSGATWTNKKFKEIVKMALEKAAAPVTGDASSAYDAFKDGVYTVKTNVDAEKYYVEATVTIEGGKITAADWTAYDDNTKVPFDAEYYKVYEAQGADPIYVQQAKDDWSGSRDYSAKFIENQNINKVDAVSAATWAYIEFEEVMNLALAQATEGILPVYKDGIYEGQTPIDVDKYYAKATVTVDGGKITDVQWSIYDSARQDLPFDKDYPANVTDGWQVFQINQNLSGMGGYSDQLLETQNPYQVDAVTGATWSNIKFRQAVDAALSNAK